MPTYLCHGFRWQRRSVRVYVILQNLDDASPEWIIPAKSSQSILKSFYEVFEFLPYCSPKRGRYTPSRETDSDGDSRILHYANGTSQDRSRSRGRGRSQSQSTHQSRSHSRANQQQLLPPIPTAADESSSTASASSEDDFSAQSWSAIKLLEEYDPHDLTAVSRPYAYVADYAVRIDLSCSIVDEIARYEQQQLQSAHPAVSIPPSSSNAPAGSPGWFEELRDQLQSGEEIRWYVVVNNDEVRDWADERSESATSSRPPEQGYQPPQPLQQTYQQQQPYQHQAQYQPQPGRPMPSREQKQHHAQYMHQQLIFAGGDREKEQPQPTSAWNDQEQKRGRQEQQQQQPQPLVFERSDQQRKYDEEKRQQQLLFEKQKAEQQRKQEEEKRQQQQQQLLFERSQQQQRRREQEQEQQQQQQQRLAWKEMELKKAQQRERERQQQREKENALEQQDRKRQEEEKQPLMRLRDQKPTPPPPLQINGATDTPGKPPMVPEKDYFPSFPRPPTANANAKAKANAKVPPPPLRPKMSIDTARPKTAGSGSIGGGLRRLFGRSKVQVDGVYSP
jgi:hypothetical protein